MKNAGPKPRAMVLIARLSRPVAPVSRGQLREASAPSSRDFDSTTAGMRVTVKARSVNGRTCGGEARSPRHTGPRSAHVAIVDRSSRVWPGTCISGMAWLGGCHIGDAKHCNASDIAIWILGSMNFREFVMTFLAATILAVLVWAALGPPPPAHSWIANRHFAGPP